MFKSFTATAICLGLYASTAVAVCEKPLVKATAEEIKGRVSFLTTKPSELINITQNGSLYTIDRTGLPSDAKTMELKEPLILYHFTNKRSAALFVEKQFMIAGRQPYTFVFHAGGEIIYTNYVEATGLFFIDHKPSEEELGFIGASSVSAMLRVTVPPGVTILELKSAREGLPFFLIALEVGKAFDLKVEEVALNPNLE